MAAEAGRTVPYPSGNGTEGFREWYGRIPGMVRNDSFCPSRGLLRCIFSLCTMLRNDFEKFTRLCHAAFPSSGSCHSAR